MGSSQKFTWWRRVLVLVMLTLQNTALVLVTKFSYRPSATPYSAPTVIACSECVKLTMSCLLLLGSTGKQTLADALLNLRSGAPRLVVPSLLYVIQNNLMFEGVRLLNPTMYAVCSQSKILTSAVFSVLLLRTRITRRQYLALFVLVAGMIVVETSQNTGDGTDSQAQNASGSSFRGLCAVFVAALISGFAGAYLERIYKGLGFNKRSIWYRNVQLACFSLPAACISICFSDLQQLSLRYVFEGYDSVVITVILLQAIGGLVVSAVLRYAGNVTKCFAVSFSICNCAVATKLFSATQHDESTLLLGICLVIASTFMYVT
jgi:UDP-sugar transporter A1/2/3